MFRRAMQHYISGEAGYTGPEKHGVLRRFPAPKEALERRESICLRMGNRAQSPARDTAGISKTQHQK